MGVGLCPPSRLGQAIDDDRPGTWGPWILMLPLWALFLLAACGDSSTVATYDEDGYALMLEVAEESLEVGDVMELELFLTNRDSGPVEEVPPTDVDWSTTDPEVVTVSAGTVTAEGEGEAVVTAEDPKGRQASTSFSVTQPTSDAHGLPLIAEGPHDREPASGQEGWKGNWRSSSFANAMVLEDGSATTPFDTFVRTVYPEGFRDGRGPVHWYGWHEDGHFTELRHVRIQKWIRIGGEGDDFESHPVGTKMGFMGAGACTGARAELYPFLEGGLRSSFSIRIMQQFLDRHVMTQNVTSERVIRAGEWQKWEYELILNDVGQSNGVMRMKVDDQLIIDYDDIKYRNERHSCGLQVWRWNPTWGGTADAVKSREDHIDIAEVKIWGERL